MVKKFSWLLSSVLIITRRFFMIQLPVNVSAYQEQCAENINHCLEFDKSMSGHVFFGNVTATIFSFNLSTISLKSTIVKRVNSYI